MPITIGSDHAGFDLKKVLIEHQGHDDINVLVLGARVAAVEPAKDLCTTVLNARFTAEERHRRRLAKALSIERRYATEAAAREQEP